MKRDCHSPVAPAPGKKLELGDIFRARGPAYRMTHQLSRDQLVVMRAIESCRSAALGGHLLTCESCGASVPVYNSCRNRHCPKCQTMAKERWLAARQADLLPVDYFHVVFTLPHELNQLAGYAPRWIYSKVLQTVGSTLRDFGDDPRWLGGQIGVSAVLHTWGQTLVRHIHVHAIVPGGGLARDESRFVLARPGFLFPVKALSAVFRARFTGALREVLERSDISTPPSLDPSKLLADLYAKEWVVYSKQPFAGPRAVLNYLGRYTHRVGLSNDRLIDFDGKTVRFRYKDYRDGSAAKILALDADEFIRRFLLHVLPRGLTRIRHYGLLSSRDKSRKLARCRDLLGVDEPAPVEEFSTRELMLNATGIDIECCPVCHTGRLIRCPLPPRCPLPSRAPRPPPIPLAV